LASIEPASPFGIEVFDADQPVLPHEPTRRFVVEVAPLVGDMRMHSRQFLTCLLPAPAAFLPTRQFALPTRFT
jgi:hypothetical protein